MEDIAESLIEENLNSILETERHVKIMVAQLQEEQWMTLWEFSQKEENLKRKLESLRKQNEDKNHIEENLKQELESLRKQIEDKNHIEENLKRELESLWKQNEDKNHIEENLKRELESLRKQNEDKNHIEENLKRELESLWKQNEDKNHIEENLKRELESLRKQNEDKNHIEENLKRELESLWKQIEDKNHIEENFKRELESLWKQNEDYKNNIESLEQDTESLRKQNEDYKNHIKSLEEDTESLRKQNEDYKNHIEENLKRELESLRKQNEDYKNHTNSLEIEHDIESLQKQNEDYENHIKSQEQQLANLKDRDEALVKILDALLEMDSGGNDSTLKAFMENLYGHGIIQCVSSWYKNHQNKMRVWCFVVLTVMLVLTIILSALDRHAGKGKVVHLIQAPIVIISCIIWFIGVGWAFWSQNEVQEVLKGPSIALKFYFNLVTLLLLIGSTSLLTFTKLNENYGPWISLCIYIASASSARVLLNQTIGLSEVSLGVLVSNGIGATRTKLVQGLIILIIGFLIAFCFRGLVVIHEELKDREKKDQVRHVRDNLDWSN